MEKNNGNKIIETVRNLNQKLKIIEKEKQNIEWFLNNGDIDQEEFKKKQEILEKEYSVTANKFMLASDRFMKLYDEVIKTAKELNIKQ